MIISKVDKILKQTADITEYSPEVVMSVIDHNFKSLWDYLDLPTKPGIRFPHFGIFRSNKVTIPLYLKFLIKKLREDRDNEHLKQRFRAYWKLRLLSKEDDKRRKYKQRFGSWHYK